MQQNAAFHLSLYCLLRQYHINSQKKDQSPLTPKIAADHVIHKLSFAKFILRERSGSVVDSLTRDRGAAGSSLTGVTALCP